MLFFFYHQFIHFFEKIFLIALNRLRHIFDFFLLLLIFFFWIINWNLVAREEGGGEGKDCNRGTGHMTHFSSN